MPVRFVDRLAAARRGPALSFALAATLMPLLNAVLSQAVKDKIPFFMDSIFTALSAALWGPWRGMITAMATNGLIEAFSGFPGVHMPFAICGMATALIVHPFAREGGRRGFLDAVLCVSAVTLANSLLGALVATFVFGGGTRSNIDDIVAGFALFTDSILTAAFLARLPINLVDKALAVLPALMAAGAIDRGGRPSRRRAGP